MKAELGASVKDAVYRFAETAETTQEYCEEQADGRAHSVRHGRKIDNLRLPV
ncbi:MAG: hypothetical protein QHH80_01720 [Anaerolineae bacterium]|nr:hypothetical protein [Anaerolineae bacterium]